MNTPPPTTTLCRHLRTNRMYVPEHAATALDEENQATACFWCNKTLSALGQDDKQVHPSVCRAGRVCHEA
jgi:hypothetical protein